VGSECFCFGLAKNISILVIFLWNRREVDFSEMVLDLAYIVEWNWRENVIEPKRHKA